MNVYISLNLECRLVFPSIFGFMLCWALNLGTVAFEEAFKLSPAAGGFSTSYGRFSTPYVRFSTTCLGVSVHNLGASTIF